jgi:hypothetical protein
MEAIIQNGPISRASISKQTGSLQTDHFEIVRQLELDDWVRETGRTSGHVGRTAVTYELMPDAAYIATVDLGGTKIRAGDCRSRLPGLCRGGGCDRPARRPVRRRPDRRTLRAGGSHLDIPRERIRMAVIGAPGAPERKTGAVLLAPNIAGFDTMNVARRLRKGARHRRHPGKRRQSRGAR